MTRENPDYLRLRIKLLKLLKKQGVPIPVDRYWTDDEIIEALERLLTNNVMPLKDLIDPVDKN